MRFASKRFRVTDLGLVVIAGKGLPLFASSSQFLVQLVFRAFESRFVSGPEFSLERAYDPRVFPEACLVHVGDVVTGGVSSVLVGSGASLTRTRDQWLRIADTNTDLRFAETR